MWLRNSSLCVQLQQFFHRFVQLAAVRHTLGCGKPIAMLASRPNALPPPWTSFFDGGLP